MKEAASRQMRKCRGNTADNNSFAPREAWYGADYGTPDDGSNSPSPGTRAGNTCRSSRGNMGRKSLSGSLIGGIAETQEMLDFCGQHNITADVEVIPIQKVNEAYERMLKADVKYRFSIDMASLKSK